MAYQQLHAGKVKLNGLAGIQHHLIDRDKVKTNPDIDLFRSALNHPIEGLNPEHLVKRVNQRIKNLNLKRKPRSDAVAIEDIIIGASVDFMAQLGTEKQQKYFSDALHFFQSRYGKENVMYCQCHLDESNPHIHVGVIPVTPDGRLSARDVFNPISLEKLQTDFHNSVSSHYGLERGESHSKYYLELNKFKVQKAQNLLQQFSRDLDTANLNQEKIEQINKSAHYATSGIIFTSKDKENVELPTSDFLLLRQLAENGVKATSSLNLLQHQIQTHKQEKLKAVSDYDHLLHQFLQLDDQAKPYTQIPPYWRKKINAAIDNWQKFFINYCHDVNRATVRVFIATHGDFYKTAKIMEPLFENISVFYSKNYVEQVIDAAIKQFHSNFKPSNSQLSWKHPSPAETDFTQADSSDVVSLQLSKVPDINWDMINWSLLSELEKDEIQHKKIFRSL